MARPIGADAEVTRARIQESALTLFALAGLDGVSVRTIAKAAGVSLAMVHHYFGSKDELYAACVDAMYRDVVAQAGLLGNALASAPPGPHLLECAVRDSFRFARAHQPAVRLLMRSVMERGELSPERREAALLPFLARASTALGAAVGRPAIDLRLPLQSIVFLTARYAISSVGELTAITGVTGAEEQIATAVEDHLVAVAASMLGM